MPSPPPRDATGKIIPYDHPDILDEHFVIRYTNPHGINVDDGRLNSGAFSESTGGGMSVDIEAWLVAAGLDRLEYVPSATHGAVRINVGELRRLGLQVGWDPDTGHQYHGSVWGVKGTKRRKIRDLAETIRRTTGEN